MVMDKNFTNKTEVQEALQVIGTVACIADEEGMGQWRTGFKMATPFGDKLVEITARIVTKKYIEKLSKNKTNTIKKPRPADPNLKPIDRNFKEVEK